MDKAPVIYIRSDVYSITSGHCTMGCMENLEFQNNLFSRAGGGRQGQSIKPKGKKERRKKALLHCYSDQSHS